MEEQKKEASENNPQSSLPTRSYVMMTLAGCYLVYTGFSLCKSVLNGEEGGNLGFLLTGAAFLILGCGMLFVSIRNTIRKNKAKKELEASMELTEKEEQGPVQEVTEAEKPDNSTMSISQRAHLVERLDEEETAE